MNFRYVDRPVELLDMANGKDILQEYDEEKSWIGQYKVDGWCTIVIRDKSGTMFPALPRRGYDKSLLFCSRRPQVSGGPTAHPVSDAVVHAVELMALPDQTALAGEWMARRTVGECPEKLFIFDALFINDVWLGEKGFNDRFMQLFSLCRWQDFPKDASAALCHWFTDGFRQEYEKIRTDPTLSWTEGIVLKRRSGTLKGDNMKGVDNGMQIKFKWRSGASGREVFK